MGERVRRGLASRETAETAETARQSRTHAACPPDSSVAVGAGPAVSGLLVASFLRPPPATGRPRAARGVTAKALRSAAILAPWPRARRNIWGVPGLWEPRPFPDTLEPCEARRIISSAHPTGRLRPPGRLSLPSGRCELAGRDECTELKRG